MDARTSLLTILVCLLPLGAATGGSQPSFETAQLQPVLDDSGWVLVQRGRSVSASRDGAEETRIRLRAGEVLTTVAETDRGWVAAGLSEGPDGTGLLLLAWDGLAVERLPAPAGVAPLRLRPAPLVEDGSLAGLAWLEGEDVTRLEVRAADWNGAGWLAATTVAGPAAGSQTGLAAAVLEDGTWLLAWSAHDGDDDEIVWSARRGDAWSAPRTLHPGNAVPDVGAGLVPLAGGGALAAWARLGEGGYRVMTARFERGRWGAPAATGPEGTLSPSWIVRDGEIHLLARSAAPRGWTALAIDDTGRARGSAFAASPRGERPVLDGAPGRGALFAWPSVDERADADWSALP